MKHQITLLFALIAFGPGLEASEWYASPNATSAGNGSRSNAWDLATALRDNTIPTNKNYTVKPGDTVWLLGGTYGTGSGTWFSCNLAGTSNAPITIRQYPGQRAVINGEVFATGAWEIFWGFEIMNSAAINRTNSSAVLTPGLSLAGVGVKAVNLVIHDVGAPGIWLPQTTNGDREIYGCIMWGCGLYQTDESNPGGPGAPRGPIVYMQNSNGIVSVADNIAFKSWTEALKNYGQDAYANGFQYEGNITFLNNADGIFADDSHHAIDTLNVSGNYYFNNWNDRLGYAVSLFDPSTGTNNQHLLFNNNYFIDEILGTYHYMVDNRGWSYYTMTNNTFVAIASTNATLDPPYVSERDSFVFWDIFPTNMMQYVVDYNQYYGGNDFMGNMAAYNSRINWHTVQSTYGWEAHGVFHTNTFPTANVVVLRTNKYEHGRANLVIFNWETNNSANVDISNVGLAQGQSFEVRDVQNYLGTPALSATYDAAHPTITVPLTLTNVTPLIGTQAHFRRDPNVHTSSLFNAFVLISGVLYGDVNSDGAVSAYDAALTARYAVGYTDADFKDAAAADVDNIPGISAYDAALIAQRAVGLISKFPVEP